MIKIIFLLIIFLSPISTSRAKESSYYLTEGGIKELVQSMPPGVLRLKANTLMAQRGELGIQEKFQWRLEGNAQWSKSKERLLSRFDGGVTKSFSAYSLGMKKMTSYGIEMGVNAFSNKASNAFLAGGATSGIGFSLSLDLFQDFLGRTSSRELKKTELSVKRAKIEQKVGVKLFEINTRRLYWALVANQEQQKLFQKMVKLSGEQLEEAKKRYKNTIADKGEVARYQSLLSSRKAMLTSLKYQEGVLNQSLKELLPDLAEKKIQVAPYDVNKAIKGVLSCSKKIQGEGGPPLQYTFYDEIVEYLREEEGLEKKIIDKYDGVDLKIKGEYNLMGRGMGYGNSHSDLIDHPRPRKSLALVLQIPLGKEKKRTKEVLDELSRTRYKEKMKTKLAKLKTLHFETAKMIHLLYDVMKSQGESNLYLEKSLVETRKKYKQARLSVQELINEEENLVQSKYSEIETKLNIIHTLMNYFAVYGEMPCSVN